MDGAQAVQRTSMHVRSSKGHHSDLQAISQKSGLIKSCCNYKTNVNNSFQTEPFFEVNLVSGVFNGRDNFFGRINGVKSSRQKKLIRRLKNVQKGLKMYRTKGSLSLSLFRGEALFGWISMSTRYLVSLRISKSRVRDWRDHASILPWQ